MKRRVSMFLAAVLVTGSLLIPFSETVQAMEPELEAEYLSDGEEEFADEVFEDFGEELSAEGGSSSSDGWWFYSDEDQHALKGEKYVFNKSGSWSDNVDDYYKVNPHAAYAWHHHK